MVLAVDIAGDRSAERHEAGARASPARRSPCGTRWRSRSSKLTPAWAVTSPVDASSRIPSGGGARRTTVPPPFCAASPYDRPRPRTSAPLAPADAIGLGQRIVVDVEHVGAAGRRSSPARQRRRMGLLHRADASRATPERARPIRRITLPRPSESATLSATFFANHGSWASCRSQVGTTTSGTAGKVGAVLGERARATDVAEPASGAQLAQDRERHTDRRERVVDQQRAAVADPRAPLGDVAPRRRVPVGPVDVEHVDRIADLGVRGLRERADVTNPIRRPLPRSRLALNTAWSSAASASNPTSSCGPRSLPACGSMATISTPSGAAVARTIVDLPRKLPISTIRPPGGHRAAAANSRRPCSARHPAFDRGDRLGDVVVGARCHAVYTARP